MDALRTYHLFNLEITVVILLCLFVANTKLCFYWFTEDAFELVELSEQEQEGKEESKEDRKFEQELTNKEINLCHQATKFFAHKGTSFFMWDYFWTHHLEVPTPPPEVFHS